ncbi:rCG48232, isoform CRA_b [Rattus norvegicus]|uniref:RCG48232, isoform CRA_b n=1 Tax=Rattus norvegicus TaxID=10116 RepID=A6HXI2_RAT|nr:rCG48232, isoform CRA_b [Rattus norvegicus]
MALSSLKLWHLLLLACCTLLPDMALGNFVNFLGGDNKCEGQVHLQYHGQWSLMCGDGLGELEASVICRELGCGSVKTMLRYILTPEEMKQPWLYDAQCRGEEATFSECLLGSWGPVSGCQCQCVAAIICTGGTTRQMGLVDGSSPCAGIAQATGISNFSLRCDLHEKEAGVVCRQLECGTALQWSRAHHGTNGYHERKYLTCQGTESDILHCLIDVNFLEQCDLLTYTQIVCTGHVEARLLGGTHPCEGRLEVLRGLTWGTVCHDDLDMPMAHVVCRELGCGTAVSILGSSPFGYGSGPVWTEAFHCAGNESLLFHCLREPGHQCGHDQVAALTCSGEKFRLVNGSSRCEGRVELLVQNAWQPLCAADWDLADATVLCHQLNCGYAVATPQGGHFGNVEASIRTDVFHCVGTEPHLLSCPTSTLGAQACTLGNSASVLCSGEYRWP